MLRNRRRISATNYRFAAHVAASDDCSTRNSLPITRRLDCVSESQLRAPLIELSGMQLIEFAVGVLPRNETHLTHRPSNYLNQPIRYALYSGKSVRNSSSIYIITLELILLQDNSRFLKQKLRTNFNFL